MKEYRIKNRKEGGERVFTLSPPVPIVRRRVFKFFKKMIENLPDEVYDRLQDKKIDLTNPIKIIGELIDYLVDSEQIEEFVACLICPKGISEREHNVQEITEFLEENIDIAKEAKIIYDFFTNTSIGEIITIYQSIKSEMNRKLTGIDLQQFGNSG